MKEKEFLPPRLELFSDAVFAIIITIMVLEIHPPEEGHFYDLLQLVPVFLSYVLSFVFIIIYWNNHHHLLQTLTRPTGRIMWSNALLLFVLSLLPFATGWLGEHPFETAPTVIYGLICLCAAIAYTILSFSIIAVEGKNSVLAKAIGKDHKGKISLFAYMLAVVFGFINPLISYGLFGLVAFMWMLPDKRIEKELS